MLVAACVGAWHLRHRPHRCGDFLITWFIITLAMAYLPVSFQRKMIEGAHIPLALLAARAGTLSLRGCVTGRCGLPYGLLSYPVG